MLYFGVAVFVVVWVLGFFVWLFVLFGVLLLAFFFFKVGVWKDLLPEKVPVLKGANSRQIKCREVSRVSEAWDVCFLSAFRVGNLP